MARKAKHKFVTDIPESFDPKFIERLNRNFTLGQVVHERYSAYRAHVGGEPSAVQESIIKRALWLELIAESLEQKFAQGEATDIGALTQVGNTLKGYYKDLGIARTARPIRTLREVMDASP
jgi:hypothetical protein